VLFIIYHRSVYFLLGILFLTASFIAEKWERGVIKAITENCRGIALNNEKQDKEALRISKHLASFDTNHRSYFTAFFLSELIQFALITATFFYYFYLLSAYKVDLVNILTANSKYHIYRNDPLLVVFPREVACLWKIYGPSGTLQRITIYCKCSSNEYNEQFHIIAFLVSGLVLILFFLNSLYVTLQLTIVRTNKETAKQRYVWQRLSYRKRLVLILIYNNIDALTYEKVFNNVCEGRLLFQNQPKQQITQVTNEQNYVSRVETIV